MFMRNIRHSLIQHERQSHKKSEMNHENQIFFQILRPLYYIQVAIGILINDIDYFCSISSLNIHII